MIKYSIKDGTGLIRLQAGKGILTEKLMQQIGNDVRATVIKKTSEGRDYLGRKFKAYSTRRIYVSKTHKPKPKGGRRKRLRGSAPMKSVAYDGGYKQYREAHGRSADVVDLTFTGKMLGAFQIVRLTPKSVRLGFVSKSEQAKALGNITGQRFGRKGKRNPRQFIGIGPEHERVIRAILEARLEEIAVAPERRIIRKIT